jgi:hypothetical protein
MPHRRQSQQLSVLRELKNRLKIERMNCSFLDSHGPELQLPTIMNKHNLWIVWVSILTGKHQSHVVTRTSSTLAGGRFEIKTQHDNFLESGQMPKWTISSNWTYQNVRVLDMIS